MIRLNITQQEINAINYFINNEEKINELMRYLCREKYSDKTLPKFITNPQEIIEYLEQIIDIYTVSCKYGFTNELPNRVYKNTNQAPVIESQRYVDEATKCDYWITDSFLLCDKENLSIVPNSDEEKIIINFSEFALKEHKIPFLDIFNLLNILTEKGEELVIMPFLRSQINRIDDKLYEITVGGVINFPDIIKQPDIEFYEKYIELSNQVRKEKIEDEKINEELDNKRIILKTYLEDILSHINYMTKQAIQELITLKEYEEFLEKIKLSTSVK